MIKKLSKHGDAWTLVIDQSLVDELKIDEDTALEITTDGRTLVVSPVVDEERLRRLEEIMASVNSRYEKTFKRLAE